jgi:hypothetical protein
MGLLHSQYGIRVNEWGAARPVKGLEADGRPRKSPGNEAALLGHRTLAWLTWLTS